MAYKGGRNAERLHVSFHPRPLGCESLAAVAPSPGLRAACGLAAGNAPAFCAASTSNLVEIICGLLNTQTEGDVLLPFQFGDVKVVIQGRNKEVKLTVEVSSKLASFSSDVRAVPVFTVVLEHVDPDSRVATGIALEQSADGKHTCTLDAAILKKSHLHVSLVSTTTRDPLFSAFFPAPVRSETYRSLQPHVPFHLVLESVCLCTAPFAGTYEPVPGHIGCFQQRSGDNRLVWEDDSQQWSLADLPNPHEAMCSMTGLSLRKILSVDSGALEGWSQPHLDCLMRIADAQRDAAVNALSELVTPAVIAASTSETDPAKMSVCVTICPNAHLHFHVKSVPSGVWLSSSTARERSDATGIADSFAPDDIVASLLTVDPASAVRAVVDPVIVHMAKDLLAMSVFDQREHHNCEFKEVIWYQHLVPGDPALSFIHSSAADPVQTVVKALDQPGVHSLEEDPFGVIKMTIKHVKKYAGKMMFTLSTGGQPQPLRIVIGVTDESRFAVGVPVTRNLLHLLAKDVYLVLSEFFPCPALQRVLLRVHNMIVPDTSLCTNDTGDFAVVSLDAAPPSAAAMATAAPSVLSPSPEDGISDICAAASPPHKKAAQAAHPDSDAFIRFMKQASARTGSDSPGLFCAHDADGRLILVLAAHARTMSQLPSVKWVPRNRFELLHHAVLEVVLEPQPTFECFHLPPWDLWRSKSFHFNVLLNAQAQPALYRMSQSAAWAWLRQSASPCSLIRKIRVTAFDGVIVCPSAVRDSAGPLLASIGWPILFDLEQPDQLCRFMSAPAAVLVGAAVEDVADAIMATVDAPDARLHSLVLVDVDPQRWERLFEKLRADLHNTAVVKLRIADARLLQSFDVLLSDLADPHAVARDGSAESTSDSDAIALTQAALLGFDSDLDDDAKRVVAFFTGAASAELPWHLVLHTSIPLQQDKELLQQLQQLQQRNNSRFPAPAFVLAYYFLPGNGVTTSLQRVAATLFSDLGNLVIWIPADSTSSRQANSVTELLRTRLMATTQNVYVIANCTIDDDRLRAIRACVAQLRRTRQFGFVCLHIERWPLGRSLPPDAFCFSPILHSEFDEVSRFVDGYAKHLPQSRDVLEKLRHLDGVCFICMPAVVANRFSCARADELLANELKSQAALHRQDIGMLAILEATASTALTKFPFPQIAPLPASCDWLVRTCPTDPKLCRLRSPVWAFSILRHYGIPLVLDKDKNRITITSESAAKKFGFMLRTAFIRMIDGSDGCNLRPWLQLLRWPQNVSALPVWCDLLGDLGAANELLVDLWASLRDCLGKSLSTKRSTRAYKSWAQIGVLRSKIAERLNTDPIGPLDEVLVEDSGCFIALYHRATVRAQQCVSRHAIDLKLLDECLSDFEDCCSANSASPSVLKAPLQKLLSRLTSLPHEAAQIVRIEAMLRTLLDQAQPAADLTAEDLDVEPEDRVAAPLAAWPGQPRDASILLSPDWTQC
eukprot:m.20507 g.20507  ORF g.20507 m.20507 type:complete len:1462 (+) comp3540_c0_seq1:159-4544(+)